MPTKFNNIKHTYCQSIMHGYSIHGNGRVRPCCVSKAETKNYMPNTDFKNFTAYQKNPQNFNIVDNLEDFVNDPKLMAMRAAMLRGEKPVECNDCWKLEEQGVKSFRQIQNDLFADDIEKTLELVNNDGYIKDTAIQYLDLTLGNVCNLKCRSCNPWASHSWIEEGPTVPHSEFTPTTYMVAEMSSKKPWFMEAFYNGYFDKIIENLKVINFLGGEPLVVKEHYDWLERIIDRGYAYKISLQYNTNGTTIPKRILDLWKYFKQVTISLSLDATNELAYYVRFPSKWHVVQKNVGKLAEYCSRHNNLCVQTHMTISCLNLHALPDMLKWCKQNYDTWNYIDKTDPAQWRHYGYINFLPHFNIVERPSNMHVCHLPELEKIKLDAMLTEQYLLYKESNIPEWEQYSLQNLIGLKNVLGSQRDETEWQKFIDNTRASDRFRNVNIVDYIPWMENYI